MKTKKNKSQISDAMLGAIAGINLGSGLLADDLSSLKGMSFGTGLVILLALAIRNKQKNN